MGIYFAQPHKTDKSGKKYFEIFEWGYKIIGGNLKSFGHIKLSDKTKNAETYEDDPIGSDGVLPIRYH